MIEVRQYDQYIIRIDGSGRLTLRNRKFLRKYIPVHHPEPRRSIIDDMARFTPRPFTIPLEERRDKPLRHKVTTETNRDQPYVPATCPTPASSPHPTAPAAKIPMEPPVAPAPATPPVAGPDMPQP